MRAWTGRRPALPAWGDVLLALSLAGLSLIEIWVEPIFQTGLPGPRIAMSVFALLATLPLAWRRAHPLPCLLTLIVGLLGLGFVGDRDQASFEPFLALLVGAYSLAGRSSPREVAIGIALALAGGASYAALTYDDADAPVDVAVPFLFLGAAVVVGAEVRRHRGRAALLAERASLLAEERDRKSQAAAAEERARIARELHDAVAHSVGLTVMHIGAARLVLAQDQERSRELMLTAEQRGREALAEMRRMLGILRLEEPEPLAPVPSLRQLGDLSERMSAAGLEVELRMEGTLAHLPPGLDLSAYRIVQEGLTNALKHGSEPRASVTVTREARELVIQIANPSVHRNGEPSSGGQGLIGMEERARLFGGTISARPRNGEWTVEARLPLEGTEL